MSDQKNHNQDHMAQATTDVLKDPVCGMTVTEESKYHEEFKGKTSVHDKFHRTLVLSGFFFLKIASTFLNSSFFPKPIKRRIAI